MFKTIKCSYNSLKTIFSNNLRYYHRTQMILKDEKPSRNISPKFEPFVDSRSPIILDVEEERRLATENIVETVKEEINVFEGISPLRGERGVFEIEDLVNLLRNESADDIFVARVPPEYSYVDFIVVVTGRSTRHMLALAEFTRRVFKYKSQGQDIVPQVEGKNSRDWMALDLGNIALHIFSTNKRKYYDLESLWSVGPEFDAKYNQEDDPTTALIKQHSIYLSDLLPINKQNAID